MKESLCSYISNLQHMVDDERFHEALLNTKVLPPDVESRMRLDKYRFVVGAELSTLPRDWKGEDIFFHICGSNGDLLHEVKGVVLLNHLFVEMIVALVADVCMEKLGEL